MKKKKVSKAKARAKVRRLTLVAWSKAVRARAGHKCEVCGRAHGDLNPKGNPIRLNAHHIEDKANQTLRFDIDNGVCLCPTCHKFGHDSAHRSPIWFVQWLERYLPARFGHVWAMRNAAPPGPEGVAELLKRLQEAA